MLPGGIPFHLPCVPSRPLLFGHPSHIAPTLCHQMDQNRPCYPSSWSSMRHRLNCSLPLTMALFRVRPSVVRRSCPLAARIGDWFLIGYSFPFDSDPDILLPGS